MNEFEKTIVTKGSGYENSIQRLFNVVTSDLPRKDKVDLVRKEYGIGGSVNTDFKVDYDSKGLELTINEKKIPFTWTQVLDMYEAYFMGWLTPKYSDWELEDYIENRIIPIEPMTAKEEDREEELEKMLTGTDYYAEEKLDGTRATLHVYGDEVRLFSRRISKKTGWYAENTDSVPHLRELGRKHLHKTILDGEMFIPNRPFKDVASTLNCSPDKAIRRQGELGFIEFNAFDIVYFKGIYVAKMPLWKRKKLMQEAVAGLGYKYIRPVKYSFEGFYEVIPKDFTVDSNLYPALAEALLEREPGGVFLNKKAYYDYIVSRGGEGLILKHKDGKYFHKRGREYTKMKKFLTKDCIVLGFNEPTKEYNGKNPETWQYWYHPESDSCWEGINECKGFDEALSVPVSKFFAKGWVGNIRFGVVVTPEEVKAWEKVNKSKAVVEEIDGVLLLEVGECSGFSEEQREEFSSDPDSYIGKTVEILANELFEKTGKLRHPRFFRMRDDKSPEECTWENHIRP